MQIPFLFSCFVKDLHHLESLPRESLPRSRSRSRVYAVDVVDVVGIVENGRCGQDESETYSLDDNDVHDIGDVPPLLLPRIQLQSLGQVQT